ncbi:MAG: NAD-dependent epimerase/dehydratase family protein [Nitrospinales bacterium]
MPKAQISNHKVLVTGASGFIGSHLCRRLNEMGAEVHGISQKKQPSNPNGLQWWQGDLSDFETVQKLLNTIRPDFIFHLASHVVGARDLNQVLPTFRYNFLSSLNLLLGAHEIECKRILLTGSLEEPDLGDPECIPSSPYAAAKWAGNGYARMFHALYQLPVVILRVFMVYGPAQQDLSKLIPFVTLSLLRKEAPTLSSGTREVDWIYVEDVVEAFIAAAQGPGLEGKTLEVGSGKLISVRAIIERLNQLIDPEIKPLFGSVPERPLEQVRVADIKTTQKLTGWKPETSLEKGLKQTVAWYQRQLEEGKL